MWKISKNGLKKFIIICEKLRVYFLTALHYRYRARRSNQEVTAASANAMHLSRRAAASDQNFTEIVWKWSCSAGLPAAAAPLRCIAQLRLCIEKIVHHLSFKTIWNSGRTFKTNTAQNTYIIFIFGKIVANLVHSVTYRGNLRWIPNLPTSAVAFDSRCISYIHDWYHSQCTWGLITQGKNQYPSTLPLTQALKKSQR